MRIDFITLFPEMVLPATEHSILARASRAGVVSFGAQNPRDFAQDKHRTVDDSPYGGGPGMVMMAPLIESALVACQPRANAAARAGSAPGSTRSSLLIRWGRNTRKLTLANSRNSIS